jgi:hypothetical protein
VGSNAKKKTTFAKLNREAKLRDKRAAKAARKAERKLAAEAPPEQQPVADAPAENDEQPAGTPAG